MKKIIILVLALMITFSCNVKADNSSNINVGCYDIYLGQHLKDAGRILSQNKDFKIHFAKFSDEGLFSELDDATQAESNVILIKNKSDKNIFYLSSDDGKNVGLIQLYLKNISPKVNLSEKDIFYSLVNAKKIKRKTLVEHDDEMNCIISKIEFKDNTSVYLWHLYLDSDIKNTIDFISELKMIESQQENDKIYLCNIPVYRYMFMSEKFFNILIENS